MRQVLARAVFFQTTWCLLKDVAEIPIEFNIIGLGSFNDRVPFSRFLGSGFAIAEQPDMLPEGNRSLRLWIASSGLRI